MNPARSDLPAPPDLPARRVLLVLAGPPDLLVLLERPDLPALLDLLGLPVPQARPASPPPCPPAPAAASS